MNRLIQKNTALLKRKAYFLVLLDLLSRKFILGRHGDLWATFQINPIHKFDELVVSVDHYVARTLANSGIYINELGRESTTNISELLGLPWEAVKDITPNGLIVPKHESIDLYENILLSCLNIIEMITPDKMLKYIDGSPNVRFKASKEPTSYRTTRPTELPHLDCWAGTDVNSINLYIPIAGDVKGNTVQLYDVPDSWQEEWTLPRSYAEGEEIAKMYTKGDTMRSEHFVPKLGEALIWDSSVCHSTLRKRGCGARMSIDLHFTPNRLEYDISSLAPNNHWKSSEKKQGVLHASDLYQLRLGRANLTAAASTGTVPDEVKGSHSAGIIITPKP